MCSFTAFIEDLHEYLSGKRYCAGNIIRKHTKKLEQVGDVSFPKDIKSWHTVIGCTKDTDKDKLTILDYLSSKTNIEYQLQQLVKESEKWHINVHNYKLVENDIYLYLYRPHVFYSCIKTVLTSKESYGFDNKIFHNKISVSLDFTNDCSHITLTELRALLLQSVTSNLINSLSKKNVQCENWDINITLKSNKKSSNTIVCGSVLNEAGVKNLTITANELYNKRTIDMRLMAQHKYGVRIKSLPVWEEYFQTLGKACVTLEMLQNKPHKSIKISLSDLQTTHKGPSFIFYNCARLSALFKEFDSRVTNKIYPSLPPLENVDFTLLNQPEEWELLYVYILQFPTIIINSINSIESGLISPHNLVSFLSSLVSVFSVYYRRVKILINAKEHLFATLHARIYLLKALQQVFHNCLSLLNIQPINKM